MKLFGAFFVFLWIATAHGGTSSPDTLSQTETKLQRIENNAALAKPDPTPTEFTQPEINTYFASGRVKLPAGIQAITFEEEPGIITASCRVDFDQVKAGRNSANPLLSLFSGIHDVVVVAQARGSGGTGLVNVQTVSLDGVEIPQFILQLFVEKYLEPKYPNVGLESRFALPDKIDSAIVGDRIVTVAQK